MKQRSLVNTGDSIQFEVLREETLETLTAFSLTPDGLA